MRYKEPLKNGSARNSKLSSLTVSIAPRTNGTLVSTNKEFMSTEYVYTDIVYVPLFNF